MNGTTLLAAGDSPRTYDYYSGFQHEELSIYRRLAIGAS